jgi:uncharacterized protein (TIGR03118 family)
MSRNLRSLVFSAIVILMSLAVHNSASAQYKVTRLVANQPDRAPNTDPNLVNAWGLARGPSSPFWVSDEGTGLSTLYDFQGHPQQLVVAIPSASGSGQGSPTGIVFNGSTNFVVSRDGASGPAIFLFATLDGTISGWNPGVDLFHAVKASDQSSSGVVYTGLAIASDINWIYGADAANNKVDVYDSNFNLIFTFNDPTIPDGFTPYGIQVIDKKVYVTFASPNNVRGGFLDVFDEFGHRIKRLISGSELNQPWGIALAPASFGPFSNALLLSNNLPNGTINAFDRKTGKFLGRLRDTHGRPIVIDQIWGIAFGGGAPANGATNQLFYTSGPDNYARGAFGVIEFAGN